MTSVKEIDNCYGCGVCATICARHAVKIELNNRGFYIPYVNETICTNCGLCVDVCAFAHESLALSNNYLNGYGGWSNDSNVRIRCSSGGVGYELGKYLLLNGYKVCAVKYNATKQRAEHYIATNEKELMYSVGSKYIQSYTVDGFKQINKKEKYLVTGTPCQIDSFRRYIRKFNVEDNFILMDFFCHSVPSLLAWKKYLQIVEKETGPTVYASWRNKFTGWHDSWAIAVDGTLTSDNLKHINHYDIYSTEEKHQYNSRWSQGDIFYKLFLGDYCCNPACVKNCKYKYDKSSADIRIGDFWGKTYSQNEDGVSAIVAYTEIGDDILKKLDCTLVEHPFEVVAEGQMKYNAGRHFLSNTVFYWLSVTKSNILVIKLIFIIDWIYRFPKRLLTKIIRLIK